MNFLRAKYRQMKKNEQTAMKIAMEMPHLINSSSSITPHPQPPQINSSSLIYSTKQIIKNENNNKLESPPPAEPTIIKKEKSENNEQNNIKIKSNNQQRSQHFERSDHQLFQDLGIM
jgi:hypothetical protein